MEARLGPFSDEPGPRFGRSVEASRVPLHGAANGRRAETTIEPAKAEHAPQICQAQSIKSSSEIIEHLDLPPSLPRWAGQPEARITCARKTAVKPAPKVRSLLGFAKPTIEDAAEARPVERRARGEGDPAELFPLPHQLRLAGRSSGGAAASKQHQLPAFRRSHRRATA